MNVPIQSLWIGPRLSTMERLSIASFLAHDHPFHLYTYEPIDGVPPGTVLLDANEIIPGSRIFRYTGNGSYAGFANFFRYKLLLDRGGWWVDLDTVCLQPYRFESDYVFSSEIDHLGQTVAANCVLKAEPQSAFASYAWRVCESKDPSALKWGETGPRLAAEAIRELGLESALQTPAVFCPLAFDQWERVIDITCSLSFGIQTRSVHLWHEMWRHYGRDPDAPYASDCLYERLKSRYLPP
ncbi:MAG TPA: hypothetical protein VGL72_25355 [Bryobacteraceae bacterium]|jgi:hypothetical protein